LDFCIYLSDSKRVDTGNGPVAEIVTDPEDPTNLSSPVEVKFDASNIEVDERKFKIVAYDWNFGDKSSGTGQVTSHVYTDKGVFTATLTVTVEDRSTNELIEGGKFTKIVSISNESLAAVFTADPNSGEAPLKVKFDATGSKDPDGEIESYEWDLDEDGNFDDETKSQFEYELKKVGTYKIGLRVTSTTRDFNIYEKEIVVKEQVGPEAKITVVGEPTEFNPGTTYTFKADDSTSPNGKITKYEWDFGDDSKTATTKTVTHSYTQVGKYELKLKLTDETKEEGEVTMMIDVKPPKTAPKAVIKTDPAVESGSLVLEGKTPFAVAFDARETTDPDDNVVDYQWDFDNDGTPDAYEATINHTFTQSGNYTVTLSVIDADDNIGKTSLLVKVAERGVTAILTADTVAGEAPLSVAFDASGSTYPKGQITTYRWDFGDGTPQKLGTATITHQYVQVGTYTAKVTVVGADNTTDVSTLMITVRDTQLASCFTSTFTEGPAPLNVTFDPSCASGAVSRYFWDFGDGGTSTDIKPTHTFTTAGKFKVTLEVADSDKNTAKSEVMIDVQ
jgi:PKD repeat protein